MKTDYKIEGDKLKVSFSKGFDVDTDNDGEASAKAAFSADLELDGSEILEELMKSSTLAQKAKELLDKAGIKV